MPRIIGVLCALLAGCTTALPAADSVTLRPDETGIRVEYRFATPRTSVSFETPTAPKAEISADSDVAVSEAGLTWDRPRTFLSASLRPDEQRVDGRYPLLTRVGAGWLVFAPSLSADPRAANLRFALPDGWMTLRGPGLHPDFGFVYMGPPVRPSERVIVGSDVDQRAAALLAATRGELLSEFEEKLELSRPYDPLVFISRLDDREAGRFVGDVSPNGVINIQLSDGREGEPPLDDGLVHFLAHELFHVWNAQQDRPGDASWWLVEGAAEYMAMRVTRTSGVIDGAEFEARLVHNLNACVRELPREAGLVAASEEMLRKTRYTCGSVIQWLADISVGGWDSDAYYSRWSRLLKMAVYEDSDFFQEFGVLPGSNRPTAIASLLYGDDARLEHILSALTQAGVPVALEEPTADEFTAAALSAFYANVCDGVGGVGKSRGRWMLYIAGDCGGLGSTPKIRSVEGIAEDAFGAEILEAVSAACRARREVRISLDGENGTRDVVTPCTQQPVRPSPGFVLAKRTVATVSFAS